MKNVFYFLSGILYLLASLGHAWFGQTKVLIFTDIGRLDTAVKNAIFYGWHIPTLENLAFGILFLVASVSKDQTSFRVAAWLIAAISGGRYLLFLSSSLFHGRSAFETLPQFLSIVVFVTLILMGARKTTK